MHFTSIKVSFNKKKDSINDYVYFSNKFQEFQNNF